MSRILSHKQIEQLLPEIDLVSLIEQGFVAYSRGQVVVPPVGEMLFDNPPGDVHIKYGYIKGADSYVIKIASGFYENPRLGLPSSQGLMLVFSQATGSLEAVLLDEGDLTDTRTAAAGAAAARHLAPTQVHRIGILGAGTQARLQLKHLVEVRPCSEAIFWTPNQSEIEPFLSYFEGSGLNIASCGSPAEVAASSNLIVTTTPATTPLLEAEQVKAGTHITAVGSDTAEKIELDPGLLARADLVVADSLEQCRTRGEIFRAVEAGAITGEQVVELGAVIAGDVGSRTNDLEITVCDLTGVAVQDIQIATAVLDRFVQEERP